MDGTARAQEATGSGEPLDGARDEQATRARPSAQQLFAAVVDLVSNGQSSAAFKRTARRYSLCAADAEDAYQRSLEILLTKAPTDDRDELRAWLHTVIKHEALALRRQRERRCCRRRTTPPELAPSTRAGAGRGGERARARAPHGRGARHLKPSEMQCLLLKALGYSYDEIAAAHRLQLDQGEPLADRGPAPLPRALRRDRRPAPRADDFEPLLSAACDGEATGERRRGCCGRICAACQLPRGAARATASAPARLAELLPPAVLLPLLDRGRAGGRASMTGSSSGAASAPARSA